jgi:hypothetical protein
VLELVLGPGDELVHVGLQLRPEVVVVDQLRERDDRDPGRAELAEHALLDWCELAFEER